MRQGAGDSNSGGVIVKPGIVEGAFFAGNIRSRYSMRLRRSSMTRPMSFSFSDDARRDEQHELRCGCPSAPGCRTVRPGTECATDERNALRRVAARFVDEAAHHHRAAVGNGNERLHRTRSRSAARTPGRRRNPSCRER